MNFRSLILLSGTALLAACADEAPPAPAEPVASAPAPASVAAPTPPAGIVPVDVPPGFGYPGDRDKFQSWADDWNIDEIVVTAWNLWAGMTGASGQSWNGAPLPVWETWCGNEEVFGTGCVSLERPARTFQVASQLGHTAAKAGQPAPADTQVVSFNKFNPAMADYLAQRHPGPGNAEYEYTSQKSLVTLNDAWPDGTPIAERKVQEAPYQPDSPNAPGFSAIETKPVIFVVKARGLTPMPLWLGPAGASPGSQNNAVPESWQTCVLLDPANPGGSDTLPVPATPEQIAQAVPNKALSCVNYLYAPLSTIYNFPLNAEEASAWNRVAPQSGDSGQGDIVAEAGDHGVLAAMHVNTKTIVNWTWQTYWWQPGADTPNAFPGSRQGMTDAVQGPWRNYAMCTAWNQTKGKASSEIAVCFNPFLETSTGIPAGQTSNCMSCHGVATAGPATGNPPALGSLNYPPSYTAPIDFDNDPMFQGYTRTDFSWAIPSNARADLD